MERGRTGRNASHTTYCHPRCRPWAGLHFRHCGKSTSPIAAGRLPLGRCFDRPVYAWLCCRSIAGAPTRRAWCYPADVWHRATFLHPRLTFRADYRASWGSRPNGSGDNARVHCVASDRMASCSWSGVRVGTLGCKHGRGTKGPPGKATTRNRWRAYCPSDGWSSKTSP